MYIAEVFHSIQGEGRLAGTPSTFIRTSGCNLRCIWCDTPYTSWEPEGEHRSLDDVLAEVRRFDCEHVVITGGEPMLAADVVPLSRHLNESGHHVTVETAGTVDRPVIADLMSISPKLTNSTPRGTDWEAPHEARRHRPDVIRRLTSAYDYQLKFVIDAPGDVTEVAAYLTEFPEIRAERVMLMPQATDAARLREILAWLRDAAAARGWTTSPRLHLELFGNTRGT